MGQSPAAFLVLRQEGKTFVLTFGHAWSKLDDDWLEPDFGRRIALNLIPTNQLVEIHVEQIFAKWHIARERAPRASSVQEFAVQFDRDLVASVEGVPSNAQFGKKIRGATSLRVDVPFSELTNLLKVFPEHGRRGLFYKENWSERQMNRNRATGHSVHKSEGNVHANKALTLALGLRSKHRPNWSCCHIWGVDDARYQLSNSIVMDRRFFSCVGNMALLPTPLKAFTDALPDVKAMLRICARNLYGWPSGQREFLATNATLDRWTHWNSYPESWPRTPHEKLPLGVVPLSPAIRDCAQKRLDAIRHDLEHAGKFYPRDEVKAVLAYWKIAL